MAWTFCTSGAAVVKAGLNVNSTIVASGATLANWSNEAESVICDIARVDLITAFSSLTANGKEILQQLSSDMIAQKIIGYEPEAIGTTGATLRLNILENNIRRNINLIENDRIKTYLTAT